MEKIKQPDGSVVVHFEIFLLMFSPAGGLYV